MDYGHMLLIVAIILILISVFNKRSTPVDLFDNPKFKAILFINHYKIQGDNLMVQVPFDSASVNLAFGAPLDKFNNPAQVQEGSLEITSTDESMGTVEGDSEQPESPYALKVNFTGKAGAFQIQIKADADIGEGVATIEGAITFEVPSGQASGFGQPVVGTFVPNV